MKTSPSEIATRRPSSVAGIAVGFVLGLSAALLVACGVEGKKDVAKTALDGMSADGRRETFEGTLRVLDDHPEYADEIFALTKNHPKTLDRLLTDAMADLNDDKPLAELASRHLAENPQALENVMVVSLPIFAKEPKARAALNRGLVVDAEVATDIVTDESATLSRVIEAALPILEKKQAARKGALAAIHKNRAKILAFVEQDPELTKEFGEEFLKELVKDKPTVEKMLRAAKVIEDKPAAAPPTAPNAPAAASQAPSVPAAKP